MGEFTMILIRRKEIGGGLVAKTKIEIFKKTIQIKKVEIEIKMVELAGKEIGDLPVGDDLIKEKKWLNHES